MSYRPTYHVSPPSGRLNDPNGMFVESGPEGDVLHLYYQHDPCFPHAPKRTGWGHTTVNLERPERPRHYPDALYPGRAWDAHGCYSGGAVRDGEDVWLFYTGNLKEGERRIPSQNRVRVADLGPEGGFYTQDPDNPLIQDHEPGYTGHFRDPMITPDPAGGWRMVVGAQRADLTGAVVLYRSADLHDWEFAGEIEFAGEAPGGFMWECPNLLSLRDEVTGEWLDVLVLCPQYPGRDECGYLVGTLDGLRFTVREPFRPLDGGHAFYAPQLIGYGPDNAQALLVGWMGLPAQDDTPTVAAEGWVHTLTVPRLVTLADAALLQRPIWPEVPGEVRLDVGGPSEGVLIWGLYAGDVECLRVELEAASARVTRDGDTRTLPTRPGEARMVADGCAVEVFAGDGAAAFSVPVFSPDGQALEWREIFERAQT
ncbi:glycoside hydrolase family 32 protein [uncultured Corynebacterium sp.]|uniref:glycoside hydrolase family 32 protein n=1 Tax=uncultured Corynebacterium sp. TaxID=159447 RepID=UPI0025EF2123|nr:glycoside hydrolase family 32 protein [uncultured Corynebacterium sp.]